MTEGAMYVIAGVLMIGSLIAQYADYAMTQIGLSRGMKEVGFINGPVISKWGVKALPLVTFLEGAATLVGFGIAATQGAEYGAAFAGGILIAEVINDIRSKDLLKISLTDLF